MTRSHSFEGALAGWRVLVPRPVDQAAELVTALAECGAEAVPVALLSIAPPTDPALFDRRLAELAGGAFSWVAFTSANAVAAVLDRASSLGLAAPVRARVAAVGPATAAALQAAGVQVDLLPPGGSAAALAEAWPAAVAGESVLLPRSDLAPALLPEALAAKGYRVQSVVAYRTVVRPPGPSLAAELSAGGFDAVLFTSASTVSALTGISLPSSTVLGAIGAPTTRALAAANRPVAFTAAEPTTHALVDGL
ncbi:MAG: uroporphyrinogen-III synthase, partial [Nakamurella sp.]